MHMRVEQQKTFRTIFSAGQISYYSQILKKSQQSMTPIIRINVCKVESG